MARPETSYRRSNSPYLKGVKKEFPILREYPVTDIGAAVIEVLVNPDAAHFLPEEYYYMCTPEFIEQFAVVTCPDNYGSKHQITGYTFTPHGWTRSLTPVHMPEPVYYGSKNQIPGGVIQSKGNLYSGYIYGQAMYDGSDPWGYFGLKEARMEEEISNKLLENGFHAGLVLGTCVIDPESLQQVINNIYDTQPVVKGSLLYNLQKVAKNNDLPVVHVRLMDTLSRLDYISSDCEHHIIEEAEKHFCFFDNKLRQRILTVTKSDTGDFPYHEDLQNLLDYIELFVADNSAALINAQKQNPELKQYPSLESCLSTTKDIGLRFVAVDFEQSVEANLQNLLINAFLNGKPPTYYDQMLANLKRHHYLFLNKLYKKYRPGLNRKESSRLSIYLKELLEIDFQI